MMNRPATIAALALVAVLALTATETTARDAEESATKITAASLLDRIERFRRLSPDSAELIVRGLVSMDRAPAQLDMALLKLFGPEELRDLEDGRARLVRLIDEPEDALDADALALAGVIARLTGRIEQLERDIEARTRDLEHERRMHEQTRETLEALRRIDRELQTDPGDDDPETRADPDDPG